ncbi:28423_t:CDS:2, partial [Dentiscutata erythropus]
MENREQLMLLVEKVIGMVAEVMKCLKVVQGERCCLRPRLCYHEYWEHDVDIPKSKKKDLRFVKTIDAADKKYLKVEFECDIGQFVVRRKSIKKKIVERFSQDLDHLIKLVDLKATFLLEQVIRWFPGIKMNVLNVLTPNCSKREMFHVTAKLSIACGIHTEKGVL